MIRTNLLQFDAEGFADFFAGLGEKPFRARQVMRWIHRNGEGEFAQMSDVAKALRAKLEQIACVEAPVPVRDSTSTDGTRKWLLDVGAGNAIETVFIPKSAAARCAFRRRPVVRWTARSARPASRASTAISRYRRSSVSCGWPIVRWVPYGVARMMAIA